MGEVAKLLHTVPQFYLRGFASHAARITRVRLPGDRRYTQVSKKTAVLTWRVAPTDWGCTATTTRTAVEKVATRLSLAKAAGVLEVTGAIDAAVWERAHELGGTLAARPME